MKFVFSILILSIITYTYTAATLKAIIETEGTKTAFATTEEISVKISNWEDAPAPAAAVNGLSLVATDVSKTVALTCDPTKTPLVASIRTETIVCNPRTAESTAGKYVLTANSAKVGEIDLTVDDENSKSITISVF